MAAPTGSTLSAACSLDDLLRDALAPRVRGPFADVVSFLAATAAARAEGSSVSRAVRAGARADRLGYAFVGGYFAAMDALGGREGDRRTCLAATEVGGVHPRAIDATVAHRAGMGLTLRGEKTFVTLATDAHDLLVIARSEADDAPMELGRRRLVALRVPADRDGVRIEARPPTSFAPEVPHAKVFFEDVAIDPVEILPGHGWDDWLKPFRTVEDVHVLAASAGHLLAVARTGEVAQLVAAELAAVIAAASAVERDGWASVGGHLALEGAFALARSAFSRLTAALPEEMEKERRRLERDAALLLVAETARARRFEQALARATTPREG